MKKVLIFGVGPLQESIINRAKLMGLYTVGIDPCEDATCRNEVNAFEVVGGQDFEGTCAVVEKYGIDAIVTAATDKPLVMMACIAEKYHFPFYSVETAQWSTDKFQMKQRFEIGDVPHARGVLLRLEDIVNLKLRRNPSKIDSKIEGNDSSIDFLEICHSTSSSSQGIVKASSDSAPASFVGSGQRPSQELHFPVIVKPRDNSGSRGVKLCRNQEELIASMEEALDNSKLDTVLVEEFIEGQEYSIEALHYDGKSEVIQFTEKKTTEFPYNVELGHIQPANISEENKQKIREIVTKIGSVLHFENCPSHTELKINDRGIFVIETSPRLGGDYITSTLTPLSTGVNLEDELLHIALGEEIHPQPKRVQYVGVRFFSFEEGTIIKHAPDVDIVKSWSHVVDFSFTLKEGDMVNRITSSLNRYGHLILIADNKESIENEFEKSEKVLMDWCF